MSRLSRKISKIWQGLQEKFSVEEGVKTSTETGKAVLEAAKAIKEQSPNLEILQPVVQNSSSLLDVLCSPLAQLAGASLPFVPLAIALLNFTRDLTKSEPTLEECVALISQVAYLESFQELLSSPEHEDLRGILTSYTPTQNQDNLGKELDKINEIELDPKAVRNAIANFPASQLAQTYNQVLFVALQQAGIGATSADIFTQKVTHNTHIHLQTALAEAGDSVKLLAKLYENGGVEVINQSASIEEYLIQEIASKPDENVFTEDFTFRDIYIPLKAHYVDANGKVYNKREEDKFDLETWAKSTLLDEKKQKQVLFIQGDPGRGKSVFCRMFADWVRQYLHPYWTPILIRLRDIEEFQMSFEETLRSRVKYDFAQNDDGWLTDNHHKYLFILDGFDELRIERHNNQSVEKFIRQVGSFQQDYYQRHRMIITGRGMALNGIDRLPANLEKVQIASMDKSLQDEWFYKWYQLFPGDKTIEFQNFLLNDKSCPKQIKELAQEPLLLYMLAAMYRDNKLSLYQFEFPLFYSTTDKIFIYEQALDWVLTKQRADDRYPNLNQELTQQDSQALRRLLAESAVAVVQSGGEYASMGMVKARLHQDDEVRELLEQAEVKLGKDQALKNALVAFYLKSNDSGGVEFCHKSFREFLCAERIKQSLEDWTEKGRRGKTFNINDEQFHKEVYDLFGYNTGLTPEITEYLFALLARNFYPTIASKKKFWLDLFQRLEYFYQRWCDHEFINGVTETIPQKKAVNLQAQGINTGQLEVDIYAGLNVMILLLELHRYAQSRDELKRDIIFNPCGQPGSENFDENQLLRVVGYCNGINLSTFIESIGRFLRCTNLSGANLDRANLSGTDLSDAYLSGVYLNRANLSDAYLSRAKLSDAYLSDANLSGANLSGANLSGANLSSANLSRTYLNDAYLSSAYLSSANLSDADLNRAYLSDADLNRAYLSRVNLSGAYLSYANLSRTNLSDANLSDANLGDTNLGDAYLNGAYFNGAYLNGAYLNGAYLSGADLSDTDLSDANLRGTNLSGADLSGANLSGANFSGADLSDNIWGDVRWDENTIWDGVKGLETAHNVPEDLKKQLGLP